MPSRPVTRRMNVSIMPSKESDSELSDLDSNITCHKIVVVGRDSREAPKLSCGRSDDQDNSNVDKVVGDVPEEPTGSPHTSILKGLSESRTESIHTTAPGGSPTSSLNTNNLKPNRQNLRRPGEKGVLLGTWRGSNVLDDVKKHAVIGFIDTIDRLLTRIQPSTKHGEPLAGDYPLPPGPGGWRVAFKDVIFSDHLVGLNYYQVKEYTRIRLGVTPDETEDGRVAAEHAAVQEAIRRVKENQESENPAHPPAIAYGVHMQEHLQAPVGPDLKRRRVSGGFAAINSAPPEIAPEPATILTLQKSIAAHQTHRPIDPLPGTRPMGILMGYWKSSRETDPQNRHAVYGIFRQDDAFRIMAVRGTRHGPCLDGNIPSHPGAFWIPYEEVELEPHLKALNRQEAKEYCRVRQHQLDHGETSAKRIENETKAVYEAQIRARTMPYTQSRNVTIPMFPASPPCDGDKRLNGRHGSGGHELHQSRRIEPQCIQVSPGRDERHLDHLQSVAGVERSGALARREIARAEAAQGRVDCHAIFRDRAVAATAAGDANATAVSTAADSNMSLKHHYNTNGRIPFHKPDDIQQLNRVWARQETPCMKSGSDVKVYDGHKYERKATGPFMGKLVSRGAIVTIDGDDYVEYRVLTKPSFF